MSTAIRSAAFRPVQSSGSLFLSKDLLYRYSCVTFFLFALRDGLTGSMRYYFDKFGLSTLWFIPDIMAMVAVLLFAWNAVIVRRNMMAGYLMFLLIFSTFVSVIFMNDRVFSLFSSIKMFIPMFVGFCFFNRTITETKLARVMIFVLFVLSAVGLGMSPYVDYPWVGQTIDNFGIEKVAGKLWWMEGQVRYGGLAGDSTMAAFMTMFPYFLLAPFLGLLGNILCWPLIIWALETSTSRTAELTFGVFLAVYLLTYVLRKHPNQIPILRFVAQMSFICILIPVLLVITMGNVDPYSVPMMFFSLFDRIHNSWQVPFATVIDLFPVGVFTGCGLGCFSYPMEYTDMAAWNRPVDNFYITNFLMMGVFFAPFVGMQIATIKTAKDATKLGLIVVFNVYSITIQCYGPSYATLMFGYFFSEMFADKPAREKVRPQTFQRRKSLYG